jgi:hypothetical protein
VSQRRYDGPMVALPRHASSRARLRIGVRPTNVPLTVGYFKDLRFRRSSSSKRAKRARMRGGDPSCSTAPPSQALSVGMSSICRFFYRRRARACATLLLALLARPQLIGQALANKRSEGCSARKRFAPNSGAN